jgi:hypothetical protein
LVGDADKQDELTLRRIEIETAGVSPITSNLFRDGLFFADRQMVHKMKRLDQSQLQLFVVMGPRSQLALDM